MRWAALVVVVAFVALSAASLTLWRLDGSAHATSTDPAADFARTHVPDADVDLAASYADRRELTNPRTALPTWHRYERMAAARVSLLRDCSAAPTPIDLVLAKAVLWQCGDTATREGLFAAPPRIHPSGRSYAALAEHAPAEALHVVELTGRRDLPPRLRPLAALARNTWDDLAVDGLGAQPDTFVLATSDRSGLSRVRMWPRSALEATVHLIPRTAACTHVASSRWCWEPLPDAAQLRRSLSVVSAFSGAVGLAGLALLAMLQARQRRRTDEERVHLLRALTHELRTPAASLALDVEPMQNAYDELPAHVQEPMLRVATGIARLQRVLHGTARYLALFETGGASAITRQHIPSARELVEDCATEWPTDVALEPSSEDGSLCTDPTWLAIALRNLVENASTHGVQPIVVRWHLTRDALVVTVQDAGNTVNLDMQKLPKSSPTGGLGLGLGLVRQVARQLGGRLIHESVPTRFSLFVRRQP